MAQRIYRVRFEQFFNGAWNRNILTRDVAVVGGAEQAIKVAMQRERRETIPPRRIRAESVELIAVED